MFIVTSNSKPVHAEAVVHPLELVVGDVLDGLQVVGLLGIGEGLLLEGLGVVT